MKASFPGQKLLVVAYGSGAHAIGTVIEVAGTLRCDLRAITDERVPNYLTAEQYAAHRSAYVGLGKKQSSTGCIPGTIEGNSDKNISVAVCTKCGKPQGRFYSRRCYVDVCAGRVAARTFPARANLVDVREGEDVLKGLARGLVPIRKGGTEELKPGTLLDLRVRIIAVQGSDGPVIYSPVYVPDCGSRTMDEPFEISRPIHVTSGQ